MAIWKTKGNNLPTDPIYQEYLKRQAARDDALYEQYAKHLQADHQGHWVAVGLDGSILLGGDDVEVFSQAVTRCGSGNFASRRIGHRTLGKIRRYGAVYGHQ